MACRLIDKFHKSLTLNSYEASAKEYAVNTESLHPQMYAQKFMQILPEGGQVLDIGCGPGRDAKVFQKRGLKVTGIDFSPKMIAMATSIVPRADFHVMDTLLKEAKFNIMEMECTNPISTYETHPMIRVFCKKEEI